MDKNDFGREFKYFLDVLYTPTYLISWCWFLRERMSGQEEEDVQNIEDTGGERSENVDADESYNEWFSINIRDNLQLIISIL